MAEEERFQINSIFDGNSSSKVKKVTLVRDRPIDDQVIEDQALRVRRLGGPTSTSYFSVDSQAVRSQTEFVSETAYLSLGSNLGDRAANLRTAVARLEDAGKVLA